MQNHDVFWRLEALSDRQLLRPLGSVLGSSRRLMAELLAHLGEVEERRLHLSAACSSLFAYCLKLGMTEDEAYRRIEAARLARRYPAIFPLLADGRVTISVVALLKHHLTEANHLELLAAITGKSVVQAREVIAARFPRPDLPSSVRKLPERRAVVQPSLAMSTPMSTPTEVRSGGMASSTGGTVSSTGGAASSTGGTVSSTGGAEPGWTRPREPSGSHCVTPPRTPSRVEPLSAQRYKVQFSASAELARKLELARDLMRHSHPGGELGPIVERALDLLIESVMQRRFGKKASSKRTGGSGVEATPPEQGGDVMSDRSTIRSTGGPDTPTLPTIAEPDAAGLPTPTPHPAEPDTVGPATSTLPNAAEANATTPLDTAVVQGALHGELTRASVSSYISRSTRRAVVERDGLGCNWIDERGVRCGSQAWLEYDHVHPRGKGGGGEPDNLRLLCRSHNRFAAEREYGREHVENNIAERRRERGAHAI